MRCALAVLTLTAGLLLSSATDACAQQTFRYPKVYGPTGSLYGPTQAHYQYQRQYGRPWHGYGGLSANMGGGGFSLQIGSPGYIYQPYSYSVFPSYDYSYYANYGFFDYVPQYSYIPMAPLAIQGHPQFIGPNPFDNSVLNEALIENEQRWGKELIVEPQPKTVERPIKESTPAAQLKSLRAQAQGDEWFRQGDYQKAYSRYTVAVAEADDRAAAHFRLAYSLVALGRYERAVAEMKRGLKIDPAWPVTGESLSLMFGADNVLAKSSTVSQVTAWVRDDIRDPDRLFLLGVLLHFDDDDRAGEFFETALRLAGGGDHLVAFLEQPEPAAKPQANNGAQPQPAQPENDAGPALPPLPMP